MPQLIAMVIVVVGAMIYMFQTFGGTGDKIEGVAQKTSIVTEINNIKGGLKLAAKTGHVTTSSTLKTLGALSYFDEQINTQLKDNNSDNANNYFPISFGGTTDAANPAMTISLVDNIKGAIPGIYVEFAGSLATNAGFLEAQIATDLKDVAIIDRVATGKKALTLQTGDDLTALEKRTPQLGTETDTNKTDGKFIIYYKDFSSAEIVK
ncbi:MAG: hypothetical protein ACNI28_09710 [Arcobacter sp.]|uniref:hypothetical protein n=1 Tax=Arcobacter sp. TaxID=1872629 RepID=UPI003AFF7340